MPRAEVGSTKHLANKMKSKGLQRLRWYCQACERQMRDENGFKCHTQSEGHVRQMLLVGEDSGKFIANFSNQFQSDFLKLLRTSHGEKKVNLNHFYNTYIANKEHVHMNSTKWPSLMEFGKFLGREGICRVEEGERGGLDIAWIDNSPDALRRQNAIRKKDRQDKGDEERELRLVAEQVERAKREAEKRGSTEVDEEARNLQRHEGEKLKLDFGKKATAEVAPMQVPSPPNSDTPETSTSQEISATTNDAITAAEPAKPAAPKFGMKLGSGGKAANVFAAASRKNALSSKPIAKINNPKPLSEAERIMNEELERKRRRENNPFNGPPGKRVKT